MDAEKSRGREERAGEREYQRERKGEKKQTKKKTRKKERERQEKVGRKRLEVQSRERLEPTPRPMRHRPLENSRFRDDSASREFRANRRGIIAHTETAIKAGVITAAVCPWR